MPLEAPWAADRAERWDEETFATWVRRNTRTASARFFWEVFSEAVFAAEPQDFSLLYALAYTHSGGGVNSLIGVRNAAQQDRVVGGTQLIAQRLAEPLGDGVRFGAPVRRIAQRADGVTSRPTGSRCARGARSCRSRRCSRAASPTSRCFPPRRDLLTQKMPAGSVIKINVIYDEPFWRAEGLSGQVAGDRSPIKFTFDNSPPSGSPGVIVCFLEGAQARVFGRLDADERRRAVLASLAGYFGKRGGKPIDFVEQDWSAEEWTRGCYGAHMAPGVMTQFGPVLREPVGRIHWAGTETAERVERLHGRRPHERRARRRRGARRQLRSRGRSVHRQCLATVSVMPILDAQPRLRPPGRRRHRLVGELLLQRVLPGGRRGAVHAHRYTDTKVPMLTRMHGKRLTAYKRIGFTNPVIGEIPLFPGTEMAAPAPAPPSKPAAVSAAEVRAWAKENGLGVPARGRLRPEIWDQYRVAQAGRYCHAGTAGTVSLVTT